MLQISFIAWIVGLVAFFLPFFTATYYGTSESCSGFDLLFGTGNGKGSPFNFFLWMALAAGIAGLVITVKLKGNWEAEKAGKRPIIAAVCGGVATLGVFFFLEGYSGDVGENLRAAKEAGVLKAGFGQTLAIIAFLVAGALAIAPRYMNDAGSSSGTDSGSGF